MFVQVAASPGPPRPSDVEVLEHLGDVTHVLETTVLFRDTLRNRPLVEEDWHVVVVAEFDGPFVEVVQVPVLVKLHGDVFALATARAVFHDPAWVESFAWVGAAVFGDGRSSEGPVVWHEVVEGVNDVIHIWQDDIVGESPELVVVPTTDHAGSPWIGHLHGLAGLGVEVSDHFGGGSLVSWLAHDLVSCDHGGVLVVLGDMGPGSSEPCRQVFVVEHVLVGVRFPVLASADFGSSGQDDPNAGFGSLLDLLIELLEA